MIEKGILYTNLVTSLFDVRTAFCMLFIHLFINRDTQVTSNREQNCVNRTERLK